MPLPYTYNKLGLHFEIPFGQNPVPWMIILLSRRSSITLLALHGVLADPAPRFCPRLGFDALLRRCVVRHSQMLATKPHAWSTTEAERQSISKHCLHDGRSSIASQAVVTLASSSLALPHWSLLLPHSQYFESITIT